MLALLPPLPDLTTLQAMGRWAVAGAGVGLGAWIFHRIAERNMRFGPVDARDPPAVEVPGADPAHREQDMTSPRAALRLMASGALCFGLLGWPINSPIEERPKFELLVAGFGLFCALYLLTRVVRGGPAVGEAPPDDPGTTVAARLPGTLWEIAFAVAGLAFAWLTLA